MKTKDTPKIVSKGICSFCKDEFAKATIGQHLRSCKERKALLNTLSADETKQKARLFHILAEGRYNPQYWVHLEVPADASLDDIDYLLRTIWFEHYEHMSAFKIDDTSYASEPPSFHFVSNKATEDDAEKEIEEEEEEEEDDDSVNGEELLGEIDPQYVAALPLHVQAEMKKTWLLYDLVNFLKENLKAVEAQKRALRREKQYDDFRPVLYQANALEEMLEMIEDRSIYAQLKYVLKVGKKFQYTYNFGTRTDVTLRVVSEREGVIRDEKKPVEVLARNIPPEISCIVCGKPATKIVSGYYYNELEHAYCDECAEKNVHGDEIYRLTGIANSPRVGIDE
jgi:hypothetical protein